MEKLFQEAELLFPIIQEFHNQLESLEISKCEFVGIVILLYLAVRRPTHWINSNLKEKVSNRKPLQSTSLEKISKQSISILGAHYLEKKLKRSIGCITIFDIFNEMKFNGIKKNNDDYVNHSLVNWFLNARPFILLHRIPSPMEVLRQQASGQRVVTVFLKKEELCKKHQAMLHYMKGMQNHEKDCLEFTLHDLKHMEHFVSPPIFLEQIGFFQSLLQISSPFPMHTSLSLSDSSSSSSPSFPSSSSLSSSTSSTPSPEFFPPSVSSPPAKRFSYPRDFFLLPLPPPTSSCSSASARPSSSSSSSSSSFSTSTSSSLPHGWGLDNQLWRELEYVISDMNCYSPHLLSYLFAKCMLGIERQIIQEKEIKEVKEGKKEEGKKEEKENEFKCPNEIKEVKEEGKEEEEEEDPNKEGEGGEEEGERVKELREEVRCRMEIMWTQLMTMMILNSYSPSSPSSFSSSSSNLSSTLHPPLPSSLIPPPLPIPSPPIPSSFSSEIIIHSIPLPLPIALPPSLPPSPTPPVVPSLSSLSISDPSSSSSSSSSSPSTSSVSSVLNLQAVPAHRGTTTTHINCEQINLSLSLSFDSLQSSTSISSPTTPSSLSLLSTLTFSLLSQLAFEASIGMVQTLRSYTPPSSSSSFSSSSSTTTTTTSTHNHNNNEELTIEKQETDIERQRKGGVKKESEITDEVEREKVGLLCERDGMILRAFFQAKALQSRLIGEEKENN